MADLSLKDQVLDAVWAFLELPTSARYKALHEAANKFQTLVIFEGGKHAKGE